MSNNLTTENNTAKQKRFDQPADYIQIDRTWFEEVALELSNKELGIAVRLIACCFKHPDWGGRFSGAGQWKKNKWISEAYGLNSDDISADNNSLWRWDAGDLVVDCCPEYVHKLHEYRMQNSIKGSKGAEKRWGVKSNDNKNVIAGAITEREKGVGDGDRERSNKTEDREESRQNVESSGSDRIGSNEAVSNRTETCREQMKQQTLENEREIESNSISSSYSNQLEDNLTGCNYSNLPTQTIEKKTREIMSCVYAALGYKYGLPPEIALIPHWQAFFDYVNETWNNLPTNQQVDSIIKTAQANSVPDALSALKQYRAHDYSESVEDTDPYAPAF